MPAPFMHERDQLKAIHKEELRKKIAGGLKSLDEGRLSDGDELLAKPEAQLDEETRTEDERTRQLVTDSSDRAAGFSRGPARDAPGGAFGPRQRPCVAAARGRLGRRLPGSCAAIAPQEDGFSSDRTPRSSITSRDRSAAAVRWGSVATSLICSAIAPHDPLLSSEPR